MAQAPRRNARVRQRRPVRPAPLAGDLALETAIRFLRIQEAAKRDLDGTLAGSFGVASTILPLTFGLISAAREEVNDTTKVILSFAAAVYLAIVVATVWVAFLVVRSRYAADLEFRADIRTTVNNAKWGNGPALQDWLLDEYIAATESNKQVLEDRVAFVGWIQFATLIESGLLASAGVFELLRG